MERNKTTFDCEGYMIAKTSNSCSFIFINYFFTVIINIPSKMEINNYKLETLQMIQKY